MGNDSRLILLVSVLATLARPALGSAPASSPWVDEAQAVLWSNDPSRVEEAHRRIENDETLRSVSAMTFHELEEILRRGRLRFPSLPERQGVGFPLQELPVTFADGRSIPVLVQLPPC